MQKQLVSKIRDMKKELTIISKKQYHETMVAVYELMNKGEQKLTKVELKRLAVITKAAEKYEDETLGLRPEFKPDNLPDMVRLIMLEKKISHGSLADMLDLAKPKLSQILNGKRKPDVEFLKAVYKKLKIDPAFILEHA
jgi:HTH-type transcriptional regulator/antitoxin HigA